MNKIKTTKKTPLGFITLLCLSFTSLQFVSAAEGTDVKLQGVDSIQVETIEEVVVRAVRQRKSFEREYTSVAGKRFFDGPYGENKLILAISQELKNRGEKKRIFTRRIKMPQDYAASSLDRYHYPLADECGIEKFKFYQGGDDFMALGYQAGKKEILFDVMTGGGPFAAPGVWGPYDQILGKRHKMKLIMGDASKDGMGLLKSGYAVGLKASIPTYAMQEYGENYNIALNNTGRCIAEKADKEAAKKILGSR